MDRLAGSFVYVHDDERCRVIHALWTALLKLNQIPGVIDRHHKQTVFRIVLVCPDFRLGSAAVDLTMSSHSSYRNAAPAIVVELAGEGVQIPNTPPVVKHFTRSPDQDCDSESDGNDDAGVWGGMLHQGQRYV